MPANSTFSFTPGTILTAADLNTVFAQTVAFAADSSNANTGTVPEVRLPYRMDQNVTTTSNVQFKDGVFTGNLTISGTMVYVNTATLDVKDTNITIAKGAANSSYANGAGITIDAANVNFTYDDSSNMMILDHILSIGNSTVNNVFGYQSSQLAGGQFVGNVNNYFQVYIYNSNTGVNASTDMALYNDLGTSTNSFIDVGISSSNWSNAAWTISGPNDGYVYTGAGNLVIGTVQNKDIAFFVNGALASAETLRLTAGGNAHFGNTKAGANYLIVGNSSVNTVINSTSIAIGNNVSNTSGNYPASNTVGTALGSSTTRWIINANTINASGLITGSAGMTITGTANASTSMYVGANVYMNVTTIYVGNSTVNTNIQAGTLSVNGAFIANNSGAYHTGVVNALTIQASATFTANATLVNAAAINITNQVNTATLYATTSANIASAVQANSTGLWTTGTVNALTISQGTNFIANSIGAYHVGTVNAASYTVGATFTANATLVNAASINITGQVNTATLYATTSANIASAVQANATGVWTTGTVNGATISATATFTANSTLVNAAAVNITGQTNTATLFATTSANVGANVQVNTSTFFVGNSTVNTNISTGSISVNGVVTSNSTLFQANGFSVNSTGAYVTGLVNATSVTVGANVIVNATSYFVGNSTVNTNITAGQITLSGQTVNSSVFTGLSYTANNSSYLGGIAAAAYLQNTSTSTISGVFTHSANIVMSGTAKLVANGGFGTVNQILTSNGTAMYWADASGVGTNTLYAFNWTNSHTYGNSTQQANITMSNGHIVFANGYGIYANGGFGSAGQGLLSNGTAMYWGAAGINAAAQFTWTNTHTFQNTITFSTSILANTVNATSVTTTGVTINTTAAAVGANVYLTSTTHFAGNSTVNAYMNSTTMFVASNSTMNTIVTANQITLNGSNVVTTATALKVYYANGTQAFP